MTKYQRLFTNDYQISTNYYVRNYKLFMQNKANFRNETMNIKLDMTSSYKNLSHWRGEKTKPIQSQFKPNQSQFWVNIKGGKAKTNPIQTQLPATLFRMFCILRGSSFDGLDNNISNCYIGFSEF